MKLLLTLTSDKSVGIPLRRYATNISVYRNGTVDFVFVIDKDINAILGIGEDSSIRGKFIKSVHNQMRYDLYLDNKSHRDHISSLNKETGINTYTFTTTKDDVDISVDMRLVPEIKESAILERLEELQAEADTLSSILTNGTEDRFYRILGGAYRHPNIGGGTKYIRLEYEEHFVGKHTPWYLDDPGKVGARPVDLSYDQATGIVAWKDYDEVCIAYPDRIKYMPSCIAHPVGILYKPPVFNVEDGKVISIEVVRGNSILTFTPQ